MAPKRSLEDVAKNLPLDMVVFQDGEQRIRYSYDKDTRLWSELEYYILSAILTDIAGTHSGTHSGSKLIKGKLLGELDYLKFVEKPPNFDPPHLIGLRDKMTLDLSGDNWILRERKREDFLTVEARWSWPPDDIYALYYDSVDNYFETLFGLSKEDTVDKLRNLLLMHQENYFLIGGVELFKFCDMLTKMDPRIETILLEDKDSLKRYSQTVKTRTSTKPTKPIGMKIFGSSSARDPFFKHHAYEKTIYVAQETNKRELFLQKDGRMIFPKEDFDTKLPEFRFLIRYLLESGATPPMYKSGVLKVTI
jgi:hypothetical protein